MLGWFKKRGKPPEDDDPPYEGGYDFLDSFRPGPDPVPPGTYAMWLPSPSEPLFAPSGARRHIGRAYRAAVGIETFALADILRRLGAVGEDTRRVAVPDDLASFPVLGPDDQVFVVSASQEKGIRFHFHQSATPEYRNKVLAGFVAYLGFRRRSVNLSGAPLDESRDQNPAAWWGGMERVVTEMEGRGEPVQAVGQMLLGS
jgi:hypothetical protein